MASHYQFLETIYHVRHIHVEETVNLHTCGRSIINKAFLLRN